MNKARTLAERLKACMLRSPFAHQCHEAAAELIRLDQVEDAWRMWQDKTEWVQKTAKSGELGMHRADVLRQRIEKLEARLAALSQQTDRKDLKCAQCQKPYVHRETQRGCPKCAPGVEVSELEFQKPLLP